MKKDIKLSIFTPTYNRANLLPVLYTSLVKQSNKNFVWLIVDDGSEDNTEDIVKGWIKEKKINIDYYKKENGGKNTAIDFAHEHCCTEYIGCVDSDDYLTEDAVEILYKHFEKTDENKQSIGLVCRRAKETGEPFSFNWCPENCFLKFNELSSKYNYNADTFLIFKTEMVKKYKFPKIKEERFLTESILYNQFMFDYDLYAFDDLIYIGEYLTDGYTSQGLNLFFKNPKGYLYALKQNLYCAKKYGASLRNKVSLAASYYAWKRVTNIKDDFKEDYKITLFYRIIGFMMSPIIYSKFKKKYKQFKNDTNSKH